MKLEIQNLVRGKRLVLLGNGKISGPKIEGDVYVQFNRAEHQLQYPVDIWINNLLTQAGASRALMFFQKAPQFIMRLVPPKSTAFKYPLTYQGPLNDFNDLKALIGSKPSTGMMSINWFRIHTEYKELVLVGFDFFKDGGGIRVHDFKRERELVTTLEMNGKVTWIKTS